MSKGQKIIYWLIAFAIFIVGVIMVYNSINTYNEHKEWIPTEARIIDRKMDTKYSRHSGTFVYKRIKVQYSINGVNNEVWRSDLGGIVGKLYSKYTQNDITIYCNPYNNYDFMFEGELESDLLGCVYGGGIIIFSSLFIVIWIVIIKKNEKVVKDNNQ